MALNIKEHFKKIGINKADFGFEIANNKSVFDGVSLVDNALAWKNISKSIKLPDGDVFETFFHLDPILSISNSKLVRKEDLKTIQPKIGNLSLNIFQSEKSKEYYFRVKIGPYLLLSSQGYKTKSACISGVRSVKKYGDKINNYNIIESPKVGAYFQLKANNGRILARSGSFESINELHDLLDVLILKMKLVESNFQDIFPSVTEYPDTYVSADSVANEDEPGYTP